MEIMHAAVDSREVSMFFIPEINDLQVTSKFTKQQPRYWLRTIIILKIIVLPIKREFFEKPGTF